MVEAPTLSVSIFSEIYLSSSTGLQAGLVTVQCLPSHTWKQRLHVGLQRLRIFRLNSGTEDLLLLLQVAIHYQGKFYEFVPWKGKVEWEIAPLGLLENDSSVENT